MAAVPVPVVTVTAPRESVEAPDKASTQPHAQT